MYNVIMSLLITKSFNTNRQVDRKEKCNGKISITAPSQKGALVYQLHDNCLLARSCHPNSSLLSPSQIMQQMLSNVFFCSNPINSSFVPFFIL